MATMSPSAAKASATALPMPLDAPVTSTPRPLTGGPVERRDACEPSWAQRTEVADPRHGRTRSPRAPPRVVGAAGGHELVVEGSQDVGRVQERAESLPRQAARTRRFTLGQPRRFAVARDGSRVAFLRSRAGDDPATCLWAIDLAEGREWLVADPGSLGDGGGEDLSPEERARRERARELAEGIVQYAADPDLRRAAFALNGELWVADLSSQGARPVPARAPGFD